MSTYNQPGQTRAPFAQQALAKLNQSLETPFLKLVGKAVWFVVAALIAVALYAGRQKLHEEISQDPVLVSASRRLSEVEKAAAESTTAIVSLKATDVQLAGVIEKVVTQQQQMTTQLAVVGEQIRQGTTSTDKLERTVNRLSERLPPHSN